MKKRLTRFLCLLFPTHAAFFDLRDQLWRAQHELKRYESGNEYGKLLYENAELERQCDSLRKQLEDLLKVNRHNAASNRAAEVELHRQRLRANAAERMLAGKPVDPELDAAATDARTMRLHVPKSLPVEQPKLKGSP